MLEVHLAKIAGQARDFGVAFCSDFDLQLGGYKATVQHIVINFWCVLIVIWKIIIEMMYLLIIKIGLLH